MIAYVEGVILNYILYFFPIVLCILILCLAITFGTENIFWCFVVVFYFKHFFHMFLKGDVMGASSCSFYVTANVFILLSKGSVEDRLHRISLTAGNQLEAREDGGLDKLVAMGLVRNTSVPAVFSRYSQHFLIVCRV